MNGKLKGKRDETNLLNENTASVQRQNVELKEEMQKGSAHKRFNLDLSSQISQHKISRTIEQIQRRRPQSKQIRDPELNYSSLWRKNGQKRNGLVMKGRSVDHFSPKRERHCGTLKGAEVIAPEFSPKERSLTQQSRGGFVLTNAQSAHTSLHANMTEQTCS